MCESLHELVNHLKLRILGNFKKILEIAGIKDKFPAGHLKSALWQLCPKIAKKTDLKDFREKPYFINFKNMSTMFCPGLNAYFFASPKVQ